MLVLNSSVFSQNAETVTLTTYYPISHGVYQTARLLPSASALTCDSSSEGLMYYDDVQGQLRICYQSGWVNFKAFWTLAGTSPNQYLYPNDNTWKVGIGAVPVNKLDVEGSAAIGASYSGTNTAPSNGLLVEGSTGIGTATPVNKLDVEGSVAIGSSYSGTNTAPSNGLLVEGNVGIGTTSPGTNKLDVTGNIHSTGDVCNSALCLATAPPYYFGGLYSFNYIGSSCSTSCVTKNPRTNSCSCPTGYNAYQLTESGALFKRRCSYICMK